MRRQLQITTAGLALAVLSGCSSTEAQPEAPAAVADPAEDADAGESQVCGRVRPILAEMLRGLEGWGSGDRSGPTASSLDQLGLTMVDLHEAAAGTDLASHVDKVPEIVASIPSVPEGTSPQAILDRMPFRFEVAGLHDEVYNACAAPERQANRDRLEEFVDQHDS